MQFDGLVALVTGGASGLGEATTSALFERGARFAILDLPGSNGADAAAAHGDAATFVPADVADAAGAEAAVAQAAGHFGGHHVAVNCAGIGIAQRTVRRDGAPHDLDQFTRIITVNLIGTFNIIRLAAARLVGNDPNADGERGVIINTASVAAYEGQIGQVAYAASKGGVVGLTLPVARDLASRGVRCCTIAPGLFSTPMLAGLADPARQALESSIPFPSRLGLPTEYASLACQIIANPMLNGETIRLDGALRMAPR